MQIVSLGANLHVKVSIFWEKSEKYFKMSSAEIFTQHAYLILQLPYCILTCIYI